MVCCVASFISAQYYERAATSTTHHDYAFDTVLSLQLTIEKECPMFSTI
jgi:hypothetical protein